MGEQNNRFKLGSGAELVVTMAPFTDANALKNALLASARGVKGLDSGILGVTTPGDLKEAEIGPILDVLLGLATSPGVEQALFTCFERATYQGVKITRDLFDDIKLGVQAREDYYEMAMKVVDVNCRPFFARALSLFKAFRQPKGGSQESK